MFVFFLIVHLWLLVGMCVLGVPVHFFTKT